MKKPANVEDLTASLTAAAAAPLVRLRQERPERQKKASVSVFLRMPADLHARYEAEAVARTKASGKGVTVQQVMIEKLDAAL